jgi:DNA-binding IclR family transcriptional regulator
MDLGVRTGETANIGIPTPGGVARLAQVDSDHPLGAGNWVGRRIPLHASSMGKVFMAFGAAQPPFGRLARLGPGTITTIGDLLAELERVRRDGYATTWEELEDGLCSTAAPVRGSRGSVIAAVSISSPTVRTTRDRLAELSRMVVEASAALSEYIQQRQQPGEPRA